MVKIDDVLARVQRGDDVPAPELQVSPYALGVIVQRTIKALGLAVAADGEVYSPAPAPAAGWQVPKQQNVRWSGSGRRRGPRR